MLRLFKQHDIRHQEELGGLWEFCTSTGFEPVEKTRAGRLLPVPSCWEAHPDFVNYRGIGIYRKNFMLKRSTRVRLEFKGVSHTAKVYLDGKLLGGHYNAYTAFSFVTEKLNAGKHEIVLFADNSFSEKSVLHIPHD
jgi:beta-glucuronidase